MAIDGQLQPMVQPGRQLLAWRATAIVSACAAVALVGRLLAPSPTATPASAAAGDMPAMTALAPSAIPEAVGGIGLPPDQQQRLLADIRAGRVTLMRLSPIQGNRESGEAVSVRSGGVSQFVMLSPVPTPIALPRPADGMIRITGEIDAGHRGIRVGFLHQGHRLSLPPLAVGQTITVPVRLPAL